MAVCFHDGENCPLTVTTPDEIIAAYVYSADGTRLKKVVDGNTSLPKETLYVGLLEVRNYDTAWHSVIQRLHDDIRKINDGSLSTGLLWLRN